jgi:hypothetical protein
VATGRKERKADSAAALADGESELELQPDGEACLLLPSPVSGV